MTAGPFVPLCPSVDVLLPRLDAVWDVSCQDTSPETGKETSRGPD